MAIIIPSSKIYNKKNDKIVANNINKIEVAKNDATLKIKKDDTIISETIIIDTDSLDTIEDLRNIETIEGYEYRIERAKKGNFTVKVKESVDKIIEKIYNEIKINEDGIKESAGVQWKVYGTKKTIFPFTVVLRFDEGQNTPAFDSFDYKLESVTIEDDVEMTIPTIPNGFGIEGFFENVYNSFSIENIEFENRSKIFNILDVFVEYYYLYARTSNLNRDEEGKIYLKPPQGIPHIEFKPTRIDFTFKGKTITLNLTATNEIIGDKNSKNVFSIEQNELIRTYNDLFSEIYNKYKNGKETATIRCSISDYYEHFNATVGGELSSSSDLSSYELFYENVKLKEDDILEIDGKRFIVVGAEEGCATIFGKTAELEELSGKKYIVKIIRISVDNSTNKMTFGIGDEVIPMVYVGVGENKPMSLTSEGQAKVFKVVGVKTYYDGAVWQELSLIETNSENN